LTVVPISAMIPMAARSKEKENFSDEELEEIMDMHAPRGQMSAAELRQVIRDNPLLFAGLIFTFGLLLGVSLRPSRRR